MVVLYMFLVLSLVHLNLIMMLPRLLKLVLLLLMI